MRSMSIRVRKGRASVRPSCGRPPPNFARGLAGLLVWCLESNIQARGFYERMGGQFITRRDADLAGALLPEVGYGWAEFR